VVAPWEFKTDFPARADPSVNLLAYSIGYLTRIIQNSTQLLPNKRTFPTSCVTGSRQLAALHAL